MGGGIGMNCGELRCEMGEEKVTRMVVRGLQVQCSTIKMIYDD